MSSRLVRQIRSELLKARSGLLLVAMIWLAVVANTTSMFGTAGGMKEKVASGVVSVPAAGHEVVQLAFGSLLLSTIFGVVFVTGEYRSGAISRTFLLAGRRTDVLVAKTVVAMVAGLLIGLVSVAVAAGAADVALRLNIDAGLAFDRETWLILLGVVAVNVMAAAWGVGIGWVVRQQVPALIGTIVWTLVVEGAVIKLWPHVGNYLPGGAEAALYRDLATPDRLPMVVGALVLAAWVAAALVLARQLVLRRDVA